MGNNFCSLCNHQTLVTEINQLSVNLIRQNNNNNLINNNNSYSILNSTESFSSSNNLSLNQEINYSKQSQYDFNNLIYLIDNKTKNIINNHLNKNSKIEEEIKDLFFINTFKEYKNKKNEGIYTMKNINFDNLGIPKEIYKDKGLHYIKRNNHLEILFLKEMKMIIIFNDDNKKFIHNINNFNNIESFSKIIYEYNKEKTNKKEVDKKENSLANYSLINKKETNDNLAFTSSRRNRNSEILELCSFLNINDNSTDIETGRISSSLIIFQTLLLIAEEENKILNLLKSKIKTKINYEFYIINNTLLKKYKTIFNYSQIFNLYKEKKIINEKEELSKSYIINLFKNQPKILESIGDILNKKKNLSEFDFKNLRYLEYHRKYKDEDKYKIISIPYNFNLINKKILDLIISQFNFKCLNYCKDKKFECACEFCESNFQKMYECYIGKETIFIDYKDKDNNNKENNYFVCTCNMENFEQNNNIKMEVDYLFQFENEDNFIKEIKNYYNKGKKFDDYFINRNFDKNLIVQDISDIIIKNKTGKIINIKLLLEQNKEIKLMNSNSKKYSRKTVAGSTRKSLLQKRFLKKTTLIKFQPILSYKKPSLIGLNRSGQPSFFNPILQCFSHIPELTNFFLLNYHIFTNEKNKIEFPFCYHYSELINELWRKPDNEDSEINNYPYYKKSFLPYKIKEYLFNLNNSVFIPQKNTFRELYLFITKLLDKELNEFEKEQINKSKSNDNININNDEKCKDNESSFEDEENLLKQFRKVYYNKFNSIIQKNFYCEIQVTFQCLECYLYKYHYEIVNSFTFDLEKSKNNIMVNYKFKDIIKKLITINLSDCFENQERPSLLEEDILCPKCKLRSIQKQIKIIKAPNILTLFFKEKDVAKVEFDIALDFQLNNFVHEEIDEKSKNNKNKNNLEFKKNSYELICMICSSNEKSKKGSYLAYCKNPVNNWWYCYNDSIVTNVDNQAIRDIRIPKLLIYRRKEIIYLNFMFNDGKKLNVEAYLDMVFRNVISYLYVKYSWLKNDNFFYYFYNGKEIDINKTVTDNNLSNGSIINCKRGMNIKE